MNTQLTSGCHARLKSRAATPICSGGVNLEARPPQVSTERSPAIGPPSWEETLAPRSVLGRSHAARLHARREASAPPRCTWTRAPRGCRRRTVLRGPSGGAAAARRAGKGHHPASPPARVPAAPSPPPGPPGRARSAPPRYAPLQPPPPPLRAAHGGRAPRLGPG